MLLLRRKRQTIFQLNARFPLSTCYRIGPIPQRNSHHGIANERRTSAARSLRSWLFLCHELQQHEDSGWLTLRQAHELQADTRERIDALKRKLERDRARPVLPVGEDEPTPRPRRRRRTWEEEEVEPE